MQTYRQLFRLTGSEKDKERNMDRQETDSHMKRSIQIDEQIDREEVRDIDNDIFIGLI